MNIEQQAEDAGEVAATVVENVTSEVVANAEVAIENAEARAEHAEEVAAVITDAAVQSEIVKTVDDRITELWTRQSDAEDRLNSQAELLTSLQSSLTDVLSQLALMRQPETEAVVTLQDQATGELSTLPQSEAIAELTDPQEMISPVVAEDRQVPKIARRRHVL